MSSKNLNEPEYDRSLIMNYDVILIRYGELSLKSSYVRKQFESTLVRNITQAFHLHQVEGTVQKEWGRLYLYTTEIRRGIKILQRIFGITSVSPAVQTIAEIREISDLSVRVAKKHIKKNQSFALRVIRAGTHKFTSQDVANRVGNDIRKETGARVDLTKPDVELFIEIRNKNAFLFFEKMKGAGGLPLGTQGNVVALIDTRESLLAAWYLMRRGCRVIFVTFDDRLTKTIKSFISQWHVDPCVVLVSKSENLYEQLQHIFVERNAEALVTGHTHLSDPDLSGLTLLKNNLSYPLLSPLFAMDNKEISLRCIEVGVPL